MSQINITTTAEGNVSNPIIGQAAFFVSDTNIPGIKTSSGDVAYFSGDTGITQEAFVLTTGMISAKQLTLSGTPQVGNGVLVVPKNGPPQVYGLDYIISGSVISWSGLGLDGMLEENDILIIYY